VVAARNELYVIGGNGPDNQAQSTVFRFDEPTDTWKPDPRSLPALRQAGAAAWDGHRIVFAGGNVGGVPQPDVWALGSHGWTDIKKLGQARDQLAAASNGHCTVWFIGGTLGTGSEAAYSRVDVVQGKSVRPGMPLQVGVRRSAAVVGVGQGFCAIGGHLAGTGKSCSLDYAVGVTGRVQYEGVRPLASPALPRTDPGATVLDGRMYVVGGYDPQDKFGTTTVQALDSRAG
jgi:hypothetical protein